MDQAAVETYLQTIRAAGDAVIKPCRLVTPALESIAPQRVGTAHLFLRPRFVLADPTGSGKTPMAINAFGYLREKDPSIRALVLTSKSAQFQWRASVERFLMGVKASVLGYGPTGRKLGPTDRIAAYYNAERETDIWITTLATMAMDVEHILLNFDNYVLISDEVHHLSNKKQKVLYPAAQKVGAKARCVWGLSATPLRNDRLDEIYSLFELIRPGTFGSYTEYRRTYYILKLVKPKWKAKPGQPAPRMFYEVLGYQNLEHLQSVIDPFYLRRPFEVFSDKLPALTFRREDVELEPMQRKLYQEVWKWPGKDGNKILQIAAITRAQQALAAPEVLGYPDLPNAKRDALLRLLTTELRDSQVVVYSKSAQVVQLLHTALTTAKIPHGMVTGELDLHVRERARQLFQNGTSRVMLVTDAGGEALDLQAASVIVFYDLPWSYGNFTQVLGRARRFGSAHTSVLAILLVATHSFDETVFETLQRKEKMIRMLIRQGTQDTDVTLTGSFTIPGSTDFDLITAALDAAEVARVG